MSENDHPKVIVDDDFLDLRNPELKTFSRRPTSARSKTKNSSSTNTQGRVSSPRDVLPGLQKLLNTYNQKNVGNFRSKRVNEGKNPPIDSRFRRKIEKKAMSTRSASILEQRAKSLKEQQRAQSNSSERSDSTASSESEEKSAIMLEELLTKSIEKPLTPSTNEETTHLNEELNTHSSRPLESETSLMLKPKIEDETKPKSSREKKGVKVQRGPSSNTITNDRNERLLEEKSSTAIKNGNSNEGENLVEEESSIEKKRKSGKYNKKSVEGSSAAKHNRDKFEKLLEEEKDKNEKLFEIEETPSRNKYAKPTSRGVIEDFVQDCSTVGNKLQQLKCYDPTLLIPHSLHSIPSFRKSWTIPSFPLIKRDVFWGKHYNVLCEKEDRQTYKFDADDTISLESLGKSSSHSSRFKSNYMNLIFCLGCMCGIFLVAGILTASEFQANLYKTTESRLDVFGLVLREILYTFGIIFDGFLQVLTFPSTFFKPRVESSKSWVIF